MVVFETEFTFNEYQYFNKLLDNENITGNKKENILSDLHVQDINYKFIYQKDSAGYWIKKCFKGDNKISWHNDVPFYMRGYVYQFENENRLFQ